jgi:CheY-like chemotaxis protein
MNKGTLFIVEDDHDIRVTLRNFLENKGYFVLTAANGAQALEMLSNMSAPRALLLDQDMPIMDGDEFLKMLHARFGQNSISVIQMSVTAKLPQPGVVGVVTKPLDLRILLEAIERLTFLIPTA